MFNIFNYDFYQKNAKNSLGNLDVWKLSLPLQCISSVIHNKGAVNNL